MDNLIFQEKAEVLERKQIAAGLYQFRISSERIDRYASPGQFVEIDAGERFFLRRPFSIQNTNLGELELLIKVVGGGTEALADLAEKWDVIGPLGNSFSVLNDVTPVLVGGGVGAAPLKFFANQLNEAEQAFRFFLGARTSKEIPFERKDRIFRQIDLATEDGSEGFTGTVVEALAGNLASIFNPYIYGCGPKAMLAALRQLMLENGVKGEFSVENRMACGMGVCQGCAIPVKDGFKLVCKDGPVFPFDYIDDGYWSANG